MEDKQYKKFYRKANKYLNCTIAEQERKTIKARQSQGIAAAKKNGKKLGRPARTYPDNWKTVYADWKDGKSPQRWQWN